jgi:hypothetical protein
MKQGNNEPSQTLLIQKEVSPFTATALHIMATGMRWKVMPQKGTSCSRKGGQC